MTPMFFHGFPPRCVSFPSGEQRGLPLPERRIFMFFSVVLHFLSTKLCIFGFIWLFWGDSHRTAVENTDETRASKMKMHSPENRHMEQVSVTAQEGAMGKGRCFHNTANIPKAQRMAQRVLRRCLIKHKGGIGKADESNAFFLFVLHFALPIFTLGGRVRRIKPCPSRTRVAERGRAANCYFYVFCTIYIIYLKVL